MVLLYGCRGSTMRTHGGRSLPSNSHFFELLLAVTVLGPEISLFFRRRCCLLTDFFEARPQMKNLRFDTKQHVIQLLLLPQKFYHEVAEGSLMLFIAGVVFCLLRHGVYARSLPASWNCCQPNLARCSGQSPRRGAMLRTCYSASPHRTVTTVDRSTWSKRLPRCIRPMLRTRHYLSSSAALPVRWDCFANRPSRSRRWSSGLCLAAIRRPASHRAIRTYWRPPMAGRRGTLT